MTDSIIIYRSRTEQSIDHFLYDSGFFAWGVPIVAALIVGFVVSWLLECAADHPYSRRFYRHNHRGRAWFGRGAHVVGAIVAWITFAHIASPLL